MNQNRLESILQEIKVLIVEMEEELYKDKKHNLNVSYEDVLEYYLYGDRIQ